MSEGINQEEFLKTVKQVCGYWARLPQKTSQERCEGVAFSILNIFDGTTDFPPLDIVFVDPYTGESNALNQQGLLHEHFGKMMGGNAVAVAQTIEERLAEYGALKRALEELEKGILADVLDVKQSFSSGGVTAAYSAGRGSYNYEQAARDANVTHETQNLFEFEKIVTDWRKVCAKFKVDTKPHYIPGNPSASIKVAKTEPEASPE